MARELHGEFGESVIEQLSVHGFMEMSNIFLRFVGKRRELNGAVDVDGELVEFRKRFELLVQENLIEKCNIIEDLDDVIGKPTATATTTTSSKLPQLSQIFDNSVPNLQLKGKKTK